MRRLPPPAVIGLAYLSGSIPFSNLVAHRLRHVDLRTVGSGTVSGSGVYAIGGSGPLALAGTLDVAKGTIGPLMAGRDRPTLAALAGGAAIAGHDWSPFLRGAGGRGLSTALGSLLVNAWEGVVVLGLGLAGGRLARRTSIGCFAAYVALVPVLGTTRGRRGALAGGAVLVPLLLKRVLGNRRPAGPNPWRTYLFRLVLDQDEPPGR